MPPRSSSGWRSRPGAHLQLDDVVAVDRDPARRREGAHLRHRQPGAGPPRGRPVRERRVPHRRRRAAGRGERGGHGAADPGRARGVRAAAARRRGARGRRSTSATEALDFDDVERGCRPGCRRDGEPVYLDLDFIDGTKGAHVNISGISGVATKTSYATFLLYSLFHSGVLGAEAANTKALIFNVKGEDLLFLDHPNTALDRRAGRALRAARAARRPVPRRRASWPRRARATRTPRPAAAPARTGVRPFYWTIAEFCRQGLLPFLFADAEDERQQYTIVVQAVTAAAGRSSRRRHRRDGAVRIDGATAPHVRASWSTLIEDKLIARRPRRARRPALDRPGRRRRHHQRLRPPAGSAPSATSSTSSGPTSPTRARYALDLDSHQVTVVDIHNLHDRAKRFVVGVVLRQAFEPRSARAWPARCSSWCSTSSTSTRRVTASSPIKEILLDVAERGPVARHHPDRRPADGQRGRATGRGQLADPGGRPARRGRGRARRVRLPARGPAPAGHDPEARLDVRVPAPAAGAAAGRVPVPGLGHPLRRGRPHAPTAGPAVAATGPSPADPFAGLCRDRRAP